MSTNQNEKDNSQSSDLVLVKTVEVNEKLSLNFYKRNDSDEKYVGLLHFLFEDDMILKEETLEKMIGILKSEKFKGNN